MVSSREAKEVAELRRGLINLFKGPMREAVAFDLMSIDPRRADPGERDYARAIIATQVQRLQRADLILADEDMSHLVDAAAPSMPDQPLREDDPIVPDGFAVFADPVPDRTGVGMLLPIRAISWFTLPDGHPLVQRVAKNSVLLTAYVQSSDYAAAVGEEMRPDAPPMLPNATVMWTIGTPIGEVFGGNVPERAKTDEAYTPGFYQRLAAAFWTLAKQPLAETRDAPAPRKDEIRKHAKAGIERPAAPVRVVSLQHHAEHATREQYAIDTATAGGGTKRQYRHRWLVRGYWRNQFYPSIEDHRVIYVAPHIRGPEGAPLLRGQKVYVAKAPKADG